MQERRRNNSDIKQEVSGRRTLVTLFAISGEEEQRGRSSEEDGKNMKGERTRESHFYEEGVP